jgi:hypothetical protein
MKLLPTLLSALTLLSSSISALPLDEYGMINVRASTVNYNIDKVVKDWMNTVSKEEWENACTTKGGWEGWMQFGFEIKLRQVLNLKGYVLREDSKPYGGKMAADFTLPQTPGFNGMVIELKCENAFSQKGASLKKPVQEDDAKRLKIHKDYKDYTFVVLALASTTEGKNAVQQHDIGLLPIQGASARLESGGTMQAFKKQYSKALLDDAFLELMSGLKVSEPETRPGLRPRPDATGTGSGTASGAGSRAGTGAGSRTGSGTVPAGRPGLRSGTNAAGGAADKKETGKSNGKKPQGS